MILLLLFALLLIHRLANSTEIITHCQGNQCEFLYNGCESRYVFGSNCQPIFKAGCPVGCKQNDAICVDDIYKYPTKVLLEPKIYNNVICPKHCNYTNSICIPNTSFDYCSLTYLCAYGCVYDYRKQICESNNYLCGLHNTNCPINCAYNPFNNTCFPINNSTICDIKGVMKCPYGCQPNRTTLMCDGEICSSQTIPCPNNCTYDSVSNICKPDSLNIVCETLVQKICPFGYNFNISYPNCTMDNIANTACITKEGYLQYSLRILQTENIICVRQTHISCNKFISILDHCPGCEVDVLNNKCTRMNGTICGNYGIKCPSNWITYSNLYSIPLCINNNNILPVCEQNYSLKIVITIYDNVSYCFPDWLY
jgi:hypothetical protein